MVIILNEGLLNTYKDASKVMNHAVYHKTPIKTLARSAATIGGAIAGGALGKHSANKKGNGRIVKGVKTAGGAAAGLAVGSLAANVGVLGQDMKEQQIKRNVNDPEKAIRQHAEKYVSFVSSFQSEILEFNPAQQEEGEGEQNG